MLLFFISYAIYVLLALTNLKGTSEKMYYESYQMSTSILQAKVNFLEIENQLAKSLLIQDEYAINTIQDTIREHSHDFLIKLNEVNEKIDNPKIQTIENQTRLSFQDWKEIRNEIIVHAKNENVEKAMSLYNNRNLPHLDNIKLGINELTKYSADKAQSFLKTSQDKLNMYQTAILIGLGLNFLVFFLLSYLSSKSINHSLSFFNNTITSITTTGELTNIKTTGHNEINDLALGFNTLIQKLSEQRWLKDGINLINRELSNFTTLDAISQKSISVLAQYIKAIKGSIYLYHKEDNLLRLYSTYAYNDSANLMEEIRPGETLLGQAIIDKQPISIQMYKEKEDSDSINLLSKPFCIVYHPLIYKDNLIGVMELGFLKKLTTNEMNLLKESANVISSYLYILSQNKQIKSLLEKSEENIISLNKVRDELSYAYQELETKSNESEEFLQSTQNALSAHIAILDKEGMIIAVNNAWEQFAEDNSLKSSTLGINYIDVCERAEGEHAMEAPSIAKAIRDIINDRIDSYFLEYPCHSPTEKRWFIVRLSKFGSGDKLRVVVAHENVTSVKLAEEKTKELNKELNKKNEELTRSNEEFEAMNEELTASNEELVITNNQLEKTKNELEELRDQLEASYTVVKNFPNGAVVLFDKNLRYVLYRGENLSENQIKNVEGKTLWEALPEEDAKYLEPYYKDALRGITSNLEMPFKGKYYNVHIHPIKDNKGEIIHGMIISQDITKPKELESKLVEANKQINAILNNSTSVIFVKDLNGRYTMVNKTFEKLFKINLEDINGKTDNDFFLDEIAQKFIENDKKVLEQKRAITFEEDVIQDNKNRKYLSVKFPLKNKDGEIYAICGMSTDITERIEMEEAIRIKNEELNRRNEQFEAINEELTASNEELSATNNELEETNNQLEKAYHELMLLKNKLEASDTVVKNFPNGAVLLFDSELRYMLAKGQGLSDVNLTEDDIVGKTVWEVYTESLNRKIAYFYNKALKGIVSEFEIEYENRIYNVSTLPIKDDKNDVASGMAIAIDITKIKKMTEELKKTNEKRKKAYVKLRKINKQIVKSDNERMIAYQKLEKSNQEKEIANKELAERNEELEKMNKELEQLNKELQIINLERKKAYEENDTLQEMNIKLEKINEEREKAYKELEELKNKLQQSNEYKSKFLSNISHELRTPLNSIIALSKLMEDNNESLSDEELKIVKVINQSGHDLLELINDILDVSKIESGKTRLNISEFDLHELFKDMKDMFEHLSMNKDVDFIVVDDYKTHITTDKSKVSQILKNLISNAFKFTQKGSVTLKVSKNTEDEALPVKISVIDTGISIPKEKQEQIFESFYQIDSSIGRKFKGSGLGLAISRNLAELMGGKLYMHSEEGKGSTFTLLLPPKFNLEMVNKDKISLNEIKEENYDDISLNENSKVSYLFKNNNITKKSLLFNNKVFLIDNDVVSIFKYTSVLEELGAEVFKALNGDKLIEILDNEKMDYIIINYDILDDTPEEILENILKKLLDFDNQLIIYSSKDKEEIFKHIDHRNDIKPSIDERMKYIKKPFETEDLVKSILDFKNKINHASHKEITDSK
jgi:PAS domain S-box-containing protein